MKKITVITPTYNRAKLLERLYASLKEQTESDFLWLIVDDGSEDDTRKRVEEFKQASPFEIVYLRKENGGKHRALNMGISRIDTELTFIVDSDDILPENAISTILEYHGRYKNTENLCGYSFLRCYEDGTVNTAYFKQDEEIATYRDVRINGDIGGDKAEVFLTEILKKYPFPEFAGEKYLPEDLVWMRMSGPYRMVHINKCVYISEYLEEGLTRKGRSMKIYSPKGMMERSKVYLEDDGVRLKVRIKMMMLYIVYGRFAGCRYKDMLHNISGRRLFLALWLPSELIYHKWRFSYKGR
jgi:hypothetical protein